MSVGFLGMLGMGGVGKNIDAVSASISKIEQSLTSIDRLIGDIGSKSSGMKSLFTSISKLGSVNTGSHIASGTPLFTSSASFGGATKQTLGGAVAARYPLLAAGVQTVGVVGGTVWNALPEVQDALNQRQAMFGATLGSAVMPNYLGLKNQMNAAFGGYASSISSQENVANYMASYGMGIGSASSNAFMGQTAAMSLITGMSQEQSAQTGMMLGTAQMSNTLMMYGIRSLNPNGSPADIAATTKQLMLRIYGHMPTPSEIQQGIGPSGHFRVSLQRSGMSPQMVDTIISYARLLAANGGNTNLNTNTAAGKAQLQKYNITNAQANPNAGQQSYTGTRSMTTADYGDKLIAGWDKALSTAKEIEKALQAWKDTLGPLAEGKGYGKTLLSTHGGNAVVSGLDSLGQVLGGTLGAGLGISLLGKTKLGGSLLSKLGGSGVRVIGGDLAKQVAASSGLSGLAGGSLLGTVAGKVLPAAGMLGATHWLSDLIMNRVGATSSSSSYQRTLATIDKSALNMIQGGLTGLTAAGPGGLIAGMGVGLGRSLMSIFGRNGAGIDYGDIGSSGSVTGTPGGGGTGATTGTNTSQGAQNKAPSGVSGAVAFAYQQQQNPTRDWYNMCDNFVARAYGRAYSGYYTAYDHWQAIPDRLKHTDGNPPAGALVFWSTGAGRAGHVALGVGGGKVASTDILRRGKVDIVPVGLIAQRWHATYLGWTQPYFGGKIVAGGADQPDAGASPSSPTSTAPSTSSSSASGMTQTAVQPYGQSIDASSIGSITTSDFSIHNIISSTIAGLMAGGATMFNVSGTSGVTSSKKKSATNSGTNTSYTGTSAASGASGAVGVYQDARKAGFDPNTAALMTAIAGAESGWNPKAVGDVNLENATWGPSVGLWQIRSLRNQFGTGQTRDQTRLMDPIFNARSAYSIYQSQGLNAWSTYTSGAYRAYIQQAKSAEASDANLPHYSQGAWKVNKDQIAKIHSDEMIVPKPLADAVREGITKQMAGQGSGGRTVIELNFHATGNIGYDARQLFEAVEKVIEEKTAYSTLGRA